MDNIFGNTIALQQASLGFIWDKMRLHMHNVSNANTPGYKSKFITFDEEFRNRITAEHRKGGKIGDYNRVIRTQTPTLHYTKNQSARLDGNNVDMDTEQIEIARSAYHYNFLIKSINSDISRLRTAIKVGG